MKTFGELSSALFCDEIPHSTSSAFRTIRPISGGSDTAMLEWAASENRVVLTHDLSTMIPAMLELLRRNAFCPRIVLVSDSLAIRSVIDDIILLETCATDEDWIAGVLYLPLA